MALVLAISFGLDLQLEWRVTYRQSKDRLGVVGPFRPRHFLEWEDSLVGRDARSAPLPS